jgi:hypothetical protein
MVVLTAAATGNRTSWSGCRLAVWHTIIERPSRPLHLLASATLLRVCSSGCSLSPPPNMPTVSHSRPAGRQCPPPPASGSVKPRWAAGKAGVRIYNPIDKLFKGMRA